MTATIGVGALVTWHWGAATASGRIVERFERRVSRTLKGKRIIRNGTSQDPAFLIEQEGGDRVLKRSSEVEAA